MLPTTPRRSPLALGGTVFGDQSDEGWLAVMQAALASGITHLDTASGYSNGRSEQLIGQFLSAEPSRRLRHLSGFQSQPERNDRRGHARAG